VRSVLAAAWLAMVVVPMGATGGCVLPLIADPPPPPAPPAVPSAEDDVVVNGVLLSADDVARFELVHGMRIPPGAYWYDAESGAWGTQGGPTQGLTRAGVTLGGSLRADASGGGDGQLTGIFINGREIHPEEAELLSQVVTLVPGRYWVDAAGNAGYQGLPAMVNLVEEARARGGEDPFPSAAQGYPTADGQAPYLFEPPAAQEHGFDANDE
jgi:hypothetical protein